MLRGSVPVAALPDADQAPDGIVTAQGPGRDELPQADLVAVFRDLEGEEALALQRALSGAASAAGAWLPDAV